ncbi:MAG: DUF2584 family protein [bacterium]|nr:DUF2584 family protein [bacterium]
MGYQLEFNSLLKLNRKELDKKKLRKGLKFKVEKSGERLFPLHKPIEFCDEDYFYLGKLKVNKLTLEKNKTTLEVQVLKVFTQVESKIFSKAYIREGDF